jgi:hypothetical protein
VPFGKQALSQSGLVLEVALGVDWILRTLDVFHSSVLFLFQGHWFGILFLSFQQGFD